jgi:hypothetical protein
MELSVTDRDLRVTCSRLRVPIEGLASDGRGLAGDYEFGVVVRGVVAGRKLKTFRRKEHTKRRGQLCTISNGPAV